MSRFGIFCAAATLIVAASMPSQAQWSASQRGEFLGDCIQSCRENPNVQEPRKAECPAYCDCVRVEGERLFSADDYTQMDSDARAGRQTPQLQQFSALFPMCNQRVFGQ